MATFLMTALIWLPMGFTTLDEEPVFPITAIRVEGTESTAIIVATSGLKVGESYTEHRLTLARRALLRLPFVFDADLTLQRGDSYGTYVLVVHIQKVSRMFYRYDFNALDMAGTRAASQSRPLAEEVNDHVLSIGGRHFWGESGLVYATSDLEYKQGDLGLAPGNPIDLGASYYNLLGKGVFLNVNLQLRDVVEEGMLFDPYLQKELNYTGERDPASHLTLALPLNRGVRWLSFSMGYLRERLNFRTGPGEQPVEDGIKETRLSLDLAWVHDSTDDLIFPSQGIRFEAGLAHSRVSSNFSVSLGTENADLVSFELDPVVSRLVDVPTGETHLDERTYTGNNPVEGTELFVSLAAYRPWRYRLNLFARSSLAARVAEHGSLIRDPNAREADLTLGFDREIFVVDARFFLELAGRWHQDDFFRESAIGVETGLAWRTRAGLMRLSIQFQDWHSQTRGPGNAP